MSDEAAGGGLRARGEEALGDLAQALLENPLFNQALTTALGAGERAAQAQRTAMGALNIPAASELERLEQRLRSLSNRLESVEDQPRRSARRAGGSSAAACVALRPGVGVADATRSRSRSRGQR